MVHNLHVSLTFHHNPGSVWQLLALAHLFMSDDITSKPCRWGYDNKWGHQQEPSAPRVFTTWFRITKNLSWNLSPTPSSGWAHLVFREEWSSTKHCWTSSGGFGVYIACASAMDTLIFQLLWSTAHDCLGIPLLPQRSLQQPGLAKESLNDFFFKLQLALNW